MSKKKRPIDKQTKQSMREAVEKLPGLIFNYSDASEQNHQETQPPDKQTHYSYHTPTRQRKQLFVTIGTGLLGVLIMGMWLFNVNSLVHSMDFGDSNEKNLVDETMNDMQAVFAQFEAIRETQKQVFTDPKPYTGDLPETSNTKANQEVDTAQIQAVLSETFTNIGSTTQTEE